MTKDSFLTPGARSGMGLRTAQSPRRRAYKVFAGAALPLTFCLTMLFSGAVFAQSLKTQDGEENIVSEQRYVGMWVTGDGHIRHELKPNGRYEEQRGARKAAYVGNYQITGDHIEYQDDTGFAADGDFRDDVLYHAGMILYRAQ